MGDLHQRVVDGVDQGVERLAVGAGHREVGHVVGVEGDRAADQVVEGELAVGHPEARHRVAAGERRDLLGRQLAAEAVVPHQLGARRLATRLDLVVGAVAVVGAARLAQALQDVGVDLAALALAVRRVGAADLGALVPVEAEPAHHLEQRVVGLLAVAGRVGVLDPEDERAAVVTGEGPVEQGRAGQADVGRAGRGRAEADADALSWVEPVETSVIASPPCSSARRGRRWRPRPRRRAASGRRPPACR